MTGVNLILLTGIWQCDGNAERDECRVFLVFDLAIFLAIYGATYNLCLCPFKDLVCHIQGNNIATNHYLLCEDIVK